MYSRRSLLLGISAIASLTAGVPAQAFEFRPYDTSVVKRAIRSGMPVIVHVYAPWCLQCHAQASILSNLAGDKRLDTIHFFKVDYDTQKDVVGELGVPRSTLIAYKGEKEVARMSWGTSQEDVVRILQAAI
jgi:thioredoxin 1